MVLMRREGAATHSRMERYNRAASASMSMSIHSRDVYDNGTLGSVKVKKIETYSTE